MTDGRYIVGVDGGGTKTTVALADEKGNIISKKTGGPSNPRNVGVFVSGKTISDLLSDLCKGKSISASFIALAAVGEEYVDKKEEIADILRSGGLKGKIKIDSDQLAAFRCGTSEKDGAVVIAGTGAVARAFKDGKEALSSGWGYLADEGSAFQAGIEGFRAIAKDFDGRGLATKITEEAVSRWKTGSANEIRKKIYSDFKTFIPQICIFIEEADKRGDVKAREILINAGEEIALSAKTAIEKLFNKEDRFPVVFCGGMFRSQTLSDVVKRKILYFYPKAELIFPDTDPVQGAVKLAGELL